MCHFSCAPLWLTFHMRWRPLSPRRHGNWISASGCDSIWAKTFWRGGRFARDDRWATTLLLVQNNILAWAPCVVRRVFPSSTHQHPDQSLASCCGATQPFRPPRPTRTSNNGIISSVIDLGGSLGRIIKQSGFAPSNEKPRSADC